MKIEVDRQDIEYIIGAIMILLTPKSPKAAKGTKGADEDKLTVKEISTNYKIPMAQARGLVNTGEIPSEKSGRSVKVSRANFEEWLKKQEDRQ